MQTALHYRYMNTYTSLSDTKRQLVFLDEIWRAGKKQMKTIWLLLWFIVLYFSRWFWCAMLSFEAIDCNGFCFIKYKETWLYLSCAQSSNKNTNIKTTTLSSIVSGLSLSHYLNCSVSRNVDSVKQNNSQIFLPGLIFTYLHSDTEKKKKSSYVKLLTTRSLDYPE